MLRYDGKKPGAVADATILLHPNIPKPLHGIAPRVIAGKRWWDTERQMAYARAGYCCQACGVPKSRALFHDWLEAHEEYEYDYKLGRLTFVRLVALCHACHSFIHSGRLIMLLRENKITEGHFDKVVEHGQDLLIKAGLFQQYGTRHDHQSGADVSWADWRMVFEGKKYGPSTTCFEEWRSGWWRDWKPDNNNMSSGD